LLKLDDDTLKAVDAGDIAPTVAIRQVQKSTGRAKPPPRRLSGSKERTIKTAACTVTIKARRILTDADAAQALTEALAILKPGTAEAA
jgi:hypothetical protein